MPQPKRKPRNYYLRSFIIETINPKNAKKNFKRSFRVK
ncbi:hypothetical protein HPNQ4161_0937 [Helicobacter pylori NQ4161]|nr:hypothetical protein HPNQ4161_0937 [Helicobacter pylori NQ4161]